MLGRSLTLCQLPHRQRPHVVSGRTVDRPRQLSPTSGHRDMSTFMAALAAARVARAEKAKLKASLHRTVTRQGSTASGTTPRAKSQGWPVGAANRPLLTRLAHATWPAEASTRSTKATGNHEESSSSSSHRLRRGRPSTPVPSIRASRLFVTNAAPPGWSRWKVSNRS